MSVRKLKERIFLETRATVFERSKQREVIVSLDPSGVIGLRLKGTTRTYDLRVDACYHSAVKAEVSARAPRGKR
jgi:putative lipase involved disintegration of autophagic bodies